MNDAEDFFDDEVVEYPPQRQAPRQAPQQRAQQAPRSSNTTAPRQAPPTQRGKTKTKDELAEEFFDDEKEFADAEMSRRGEWFPPGGVFLCEVTECYLFEGRKRQRYCVVQCNILASNHPDVPVGDMREWLVRRDNDMCLPNIKAFLKACLDPCPEDPPISTQDAKDAFGDKAILAGIKVKLKTENIVTKENTNFTKMNWYPAR